MRPPPPPGREVTVSDVLLTRWRVSGDSAPWRSNSTAFKTCCTHTLLLLRLPASLQSSRETGREHTALLVPASPRRGTPPGGQAERCPGARHLVMPGNTPRPCQANARPSLAMSPSSPEATGRLATAYCVPSQSVSSVSYRVTPSTDPCILFLCTVSNLTLYPGRICEIREMFNLLLLARARHLYGTHTDVSGKCFEAEGTFPLKCDRLLLLSRPPFCTKDQQSHAEQSSEGEERIGAPDTPTLALKDQNAAHPAFVSPSLPCSLRLLT